MASPAKRRRYSVRSPSSDFEDAPIPRSKVLVGKLTQSPPASSGPNSSLSTQTSGRAHFRTTESTQTKNKAATHTHNAVPISLPTHNREVNIATKLASSSPKKSRVKGENGKSENISSYFVKQARHQLDQAPYGTKSDVSAVQRISTPEDEKDAISDADDVVETKTNSASLTGLTARKRARAEPFSNGGSELPSGSQKFFKKPVSRMEVKNENDLKPWAERFAPNNLQELAVHKKKVADVRVWLEAVLNGKTIAVQLLAKSIGCEVLEWRNPVGLVASSDERGFLSLSAQFDEFMGRGGLFGPLDTITTNGQAFMEPETKSIDHRKRIILIEEFPNTFMRSSAALQSFRSTITQYLTSQAPPLLLTPEMTDKQFMTPVVMIVSETLLTTASASSDSFTTHRLLGSEILQHPAVRIIEFNAVAPTLLVGALELIVKKESRTSGRRKTPGPQVLKRLGEVGDIRSAVGSLEFLCLRGDVDGDWGAKVAFGKAKQSARDISLTKMEEESLELVTRREASLGIFHAVGKVVYNRRGEIVASLAPGADVERLPDFIALHSRQRRSQVFVNELMDEIGTDTQTFTSALHENYILSCNASPNSYDFSTLDHVNGCIDSLSDSDLFSTSWQGSPYAASLARSISVTGTGVDSLRQEEISFQIAVRGLLFSLPNPVKRNALDAGPSKTVKHGDAYKMFYPTSLRLWRTKEEIESMVDLWVTQMRNRDIQHANITKAKVASDHHSSSIVTGWRNIGNLPRSTRVSDGEVPPFLYIGTSARKELILERLPYMLSLARFRKDILPFLSVKDMEKVVTFNGIGGPSADDPADDNDVSVMDEQWATDKSDNPESLKQKISGLTMHVSNGGAALQQSEAKLVLTDDDIEDDW